MAISSIGAIFKERKFPFIVALFILFSFVVVLTSLISSQYSELVSSEHAQLIPSPPLPPPPTSKDDRRSNTDPETEATPEAYSSSSPISDDAMTMRNNATGERRDYGVANKTVTYDPEVDRIDDLRYSWRACRGVVAVDYIPCLDNNKAIKALKYRKRMEHRERHCPNPSPDCLVPLPDGYKIPIHWPKSRDMVS